MNKFWAIKYRLSADNMQNEPERFDGLGEIVGLWVLVFLTPRQVNDVIFPKLKSALEAF